LGFSWVFSPSRPKTPRGLACEAFLGLCHSLSLGWLAFADFFCWDCSSIHILKSLSERQYFSNSLYRRWIVLGLSRMRCERNWPALRPTIAALMATTSKTFGAWALRCTNLLK
jgi:hypothetical protein